MFLLSVLLKVMQDPQAGSGMGYSLFKYSIFSERLQLIVLSENSIFVTVQPCGKNRKMEPSSLLVRDIFTIFDIWRSARSEILAALAAKQAAKQPNRADG